MRLLMILFGAMLFFMGYEELQLRSVADAAPQKMTCADLERSGPGENAHIEMSDFLLCDFSFVYQAEERGSYQTVWVPAVPLEGEYHQTLMKLLGGQDEFTGELPTPKNIRVIVKTNDADTDADIEQLAGYDTITGTIVNKIESLKSEEKKLLGQAYPGIDFSNCWILTVGREPASNLKMGGIFGGAIACVILPIGHFLYRRKKDAQLAQQAELGEAMQSLEAPPAQDDKPKPFDLK